MKGYIQLLGGRKGKGGEDHSPLITVQLKLQKRLKKTPGISDALSGRTVTLKKGNPFTYPLLLQKVQGNWLAYENK